MELESCKQALKENDLSNVANIVLLHLSSNNSDEHLFVSEVQKLTGKAVYAAKPGLSITLNNFRYDTRISEQTKPLTDYEDKVILPLIVQGLHGKVGKSKAITNKAMCSALKSYGCKIDSPRIRKIINHIRLSGMVIGLIATSEGYYIAETRKELEDYLRSLEGREGAIHAVRKSLEKQLQLYDK